MASTKTRRLASRNRGRAHCPVAALDLSPRSPACITGGLQRRHLGAAHAFDLPFIFGTFGPSLFSNIAKSTANRPGRLALSQAIMASVGAFARSGDPNAPEALGVTWPTSPSKLIFDATPTAKAISGSAVADQGRIHARRAGADLLGSRALPGLTRWTHQESPQTSRGSTRSRKVGRWRELG